LAAQTGVISPFRAVIRGDSIPNYFPVYIIEPPGKVKCEYGFILNADYSNDPKFAPYIVVKILLTYKTVLLILRSRKASYYQLKIAGCFRDYNRYNPRMEFKKIIPAMRRKVRNKPVYQVLKKDCGK